MNDIEYGLRQTNLSSSRKPPIHDGRAMHINAHACTRRSAMFDFHCFCCCFSLSFALFRPAYV